MEITSLSGQGGMIAFHHTKFFINHALNGKGEWDPLGAPLRKANEYILSEVWPDHEGPPTPAQLKAIARVNRAFAKDRVILKEREGAKYFLRRGENYDEWAEWFMENAEELKRGERVGAPKLDLSRPLIISEEDRVPLSVWWDISRLMKEGKVFYIICDVEKTKRPSKAWTWAEMSEKGGAA